MIRYIVPLLLIILSGCVSLSPQGSSVVVTSNPEKIKGCNFVSQVESSSSWGGFAATGVAYDNAMNELRNKASQMGANVILTTITSNTMGGTRMMGEAYFCSR